MNFPGHYPSTVSSPSPSQPNTSLFTNLIDMHSDNARSIKDGDFDNLDFPLHSTTLVMSPNTPSERQLRPGPLQEESDDENLATPTPPSTPPPDYRYHPRFSYEDGNLYIQVKEYTFRIHRYLFLPDDNNVVAAGLRENLGDIRHPILLQEDISVLAFEKVLQILYRHPLDRSPLAIQDLKVACLTADALRFGRLCEMIAQYIISNDCPDESLDEAVPKYMLCVKLDRYFPPSFKSVQVDKLCCAVKYMTHSHFYELGFFELAKIMKAAFIARVGYDGHKIETYEAPAPPSRESYLIKVKNMPAYRAVKQELFS